MSAVVFFAHRMAYPSGSFIEEKLQGPRYSGEGLVTLNEMIKREQHCKVAVLCCQCVQFPKFIFDWNADLAFAFKNGREATGQPSVHSRASFALRAQRDGWTGMS